MKDGVWVDVQYTFSVPAAVTEEEFKDLQVRGPEAEVCQEINDYVRGYLEIIFKRNDLNFKHNFEEILITNQTNDLSVLY